ncbi:MAG: sugar phosphate nucleotidyltransferase [Steroidobacteraceae bacterium]|jgi:mannose-1-phosphate guanylyltransferase
MQLNQHHLPESSMKGSGNTWAIVLAGGEGSRLHSLTRMESGIAVPKQYCSLRGGDSLLVEALERAASVASAEHIVTVVSQGHRRWWEPALSAMPHIGIAVQPRNCGTANGILLPLLYILERDPAARVVLLPSDHHVRDERVLAIALQDAARELDTRPDDIILIGIQPEEADPELGYILLGPADGAVCTVDQFIEKPSAARARALVAAGALWNSFMVAARAQALLRPYLRQFPRIVGDMRRVVAKSGLARDPSIAAVNLYKKLPSIDFSRQILQGAEPVLRVLRVPRCGWSDLGTPKRLAETLRRLPPAEWTKSCSSQPAGLMSLAARYELARHQAV